MGSKHILYETSDVDAPSVIKDRNGEVVLALCKVCNKAEIELDGPCEPPVADDLEQIIADQMAQIEQLRTEVAYLQSDKWESENPAPDPYWQGVYDNIRAAWDKWALAELGTVSPSPLDLRGRPELAELWDSVR